MHALAKRNETAPSNEADYWTSRPGLAAPGASAKGGRGLFAIAPIDAGELIERACTVEIGADQTRSLDQMQPLGDFYFANPKNEKAGLMAFGLMSLCNHADDPNADVRWVEAENIGWLADLVALRVINPGEEITYRYKCPLWFPAGV